MMSAADRHLALAIDYQRGIYLALEAARERVILDPHPEDVARYAVTATLAADADYEVTRLLEIVAAEGRDEEVFS
jgi:hypothetical protein